MLKYFRKNEEEIFQFLSLPNHSKATNPQTINLTVSSKNVRSHGLVLSSVKPVCSSLKEYFLFFSGKKKK